MKKTNDLHIFLFFSKKSRFIGLLQACHEKKNDFF